MVTLADLQVRSLGPCTVPSPLSHYVGGRATNEYYVGEDDRVLFEPDDKSEVEVHGELYVVMRERDVHAVAADRVGDDATGLYL